MILVTAQTGISASVHPFDSRDDFSSVRREILASGKKLHFSMGHYAPENPFEFVRQNLDEPEGFPFVISMTEPNTLVSPLYGEDCGFSLSEAVAKHLELKEIDNGIPYHICGADYVGIGDTPETFRSLSELIAEKRKTGKVTI